MQAALNRFGRPTTSAEAMRCHAERQVAHLRELQEVWAAVLASLPEPHVAADRVEEWFDRQLDGAVERRGYHRATAHAPTT